MNPDQPSEAQPAEPSSKDRKPASAHRYARSSPPFNPGLQQLVEGKRVWYEPLNEEVKAKGFLGWHQRGILPHCDFPGVTQFVTFRLWDSMPANRRNEWEALLRLVDRRERSKRLEAYLDMGHGACWLRDPNLAQLADAALRFFDRQRYELDAWVIMPNHVHVILQIWETPLSALVKSWKGFVAREGNKKIRREGSFWEREYWDTLIRSEDQRRKALHYIETNPVKAGLVGEAKVWPWSSARYRDDYAVLRLPTRNIEQQSNLREKKTEI